MPDQAGSSQGHGRSSPEHTASGSVSGSDSHRSRSTSVATTDANSIAAIDPDNPQKPSEAAFAKARATRPEICGSDAPERPYPIYLHGIVERGFGRGGKDLGCPTANLPSRIFQTQANLQRTGIYYGFARILPQDPDDPDLLTEGEEAEAAAGDAQAADGNGRALASNAEAGDRYDSDYDEDDDEVILSASPVHEGEELAEAHTWRDRLSGELQYLVKPRQLSRSSARSARSVGTILDKAGQLDLDRTASSQSGGSATHRDIQASERPIKAAAGSDVASAKNGATDKSALAPAASIADKEQAEEQGKALPGSSADKHPRDGSGSSSKNSSLRRKKKRRIPITSEDARVYPMVMSVGWNPFYNNTAKTAEVHIMHPFSSDFYGLEMRVVVLGYIRPEYNYVSKEALIADIDMDKRVAHNSLARTPYQDYATDPFLMASR